MRAGLSLAAERGVPVSPDETVEPLGDGWIIADRKGFRPCPWAFDLAALADPSPGHRVLDLGCGGGVLLWALAQHTPDVRALVGVELSAQAVGQARRNALLAGVTDRALVVQSDVRRVPVPPRSFDRVLCNPPFYPAGWGRASRDGRVHQSTHALDGDVTDFAKAAAHALAPHGRAVFVFDTGHLAALLLGLSEAGLTVKALRFLDDDRGLPARVLALAGHGGGGLDVGRRAFAGNELRRPR